MDEYPLRLHKQALVVDTHCDTLKCLLPQFTRLCDSMWRDRSKTGFGKKSKLGHIDLPRLKEGGVDLQVFAISSERDPTPSYALRTAMEMIEAFYTSARSTRSSSSPSPATPRSLRRMRRKKSLRC